MQEGYSVVVPVFNEERNIALLYKELSTVLKSLDLPYEIIFIDDGSTDNSLQEIKSLTSKDVSVRYISFKKNLGQSAALKSGFQHCRYSVTITMDSDLQNDPADIPGLLQFYGEYQMVNGWRKNRRDNFSKKIGSKIGNLVRNLFVHDNIKDTGCSLKVMDTAMLKRIKIYKGLHRFLPVLMMSEGAKVKEVPVNHRQRMHGTSKYNNLGRAFAGLYDLICVRWMIKHQINEEIKEKNV
ncbi:glycosyltransferase family 2 protein [Flexistipes sp.]|uniref:glycosyltransferase family 2 protein n=1 Tax=Flexistipes sp. TaxID=3088135 RepID=UPI002E1EF029|nr:glycosyltransferase family 2 protein [Flexistipes sp.]